MSRFFAQQSEYPRVIDTRDGKAVYAAEAGEYQTAKDVAEAMERLWRREVEFVAAWIAEHNGWGDEGAAAHAQAWREEMG